MGRYLLRLKPSGSSPCWGIATCIHQLRHLQQLQKYWASSCYKNNVCMISMPLKSTVVNILKTYSIKQFLQQKKPVICMIPRNNKSIFDLWNSEKHLNICSFIWMFLYFVVNFVPYYLLQFSSVFFHFSISFVFIFNSPTGLNYKTMIRFIQKNSKK